MKDIQLEKGCHFCKKNFTAKTSRNAYCNAECKRLNIRAKAALMASKKKKGTWEKMETPDIKINPYYLTRGLK